MIAPYRSIVGVLPYLPSINPGGQRVILIPAHPWASSTSCAHFFAALAQRHSMAQNFKSDLRTILRELLLLHTETKVRKGWKGFCRFLCHPSLPQKFLTQSILTPSKPQTQSMTVIPISYPKGSAKLASPMDRTVCVLNVKASVEPLQRIGEIIHIHIETRHAFIDKVSIME